MTAAHTSNPVKTARVYYRQDDDGWWADSPDVPGYYAFGDSYEDVHRDVREGLPWIADCALAMFHFKPGNYA